MGKIKHKAKSVARSTGQLAKKASVQSAVLVKKSVLVTGRTVRKVPQTKTYQKAHKTYKSAHSKYARVPHERMMERSAKYAAWHNWRFKKIHHGHVHLGALGVYVLFVGILVFNNIGYVFAADLSDDWNFNNQAEYTLDEGLEFGSNSVRLKAQEYTSDGNTAALYPFNESSGSVVDDISTNNNNATTSGNPVFGTGNLNNALTLNGTNQFASANDSSSLSITGQQTIEGWLKLNSTFNTNSTRPQTIVDKGSYKLELDNTSGKLTYEIQNNNADSWTRQLGNGLNNSWTHGHLSTHSATSYGNSVIVGLGQAAGDGEVWLWNGSAWTMIGGDGIRNSWPDQTYEQVTALGTNGTALYAGLGNTTGDGEVWTCDIGAGCPSWTKIGGDGLGISTGYSSVLSFTTYSGVLYAGMGSGASQADVWRYNGGTSWTQIGGDGLNTSWGAGFDAVHAMTSDGSFLYAGLGVTTTEGEVWRYNGTSWTQIGGDGLNSSWNTNYESVRSLIIYNGNLVAGLGDGAADAEVWRYNGTTWTQIGGDGLNSSWNTTAFDRVSSFATDGTNLYASTGTGNVAAQVWRYNGTTWTRIGGEGVQNSWTVGFALSDQLVWANSRLYASVWQSNSWTGATYWDYNGTTWRQIGGEFLNGGWGGWNLGEVVSSTVMGGKMYIGLSTASTTTGSAFVFEYDGTTARPIGGSGINNSWPPRSYQTMPSMIAYGGELYVGLGVSVGGAEVWKWNGTTWAKVAGDGLNGTWNGTHTQVSSMAVFNNNLYVGTAGSSAPDGEVWQFNGTTWSQVGGDSVNSSWSGQAEVASMAGFRNQLCAGLRGASGARVWCWSGSGSWTQVGGGGVNSSWSAGDAVRAMIPYNNNLVVGVSNDTSAVSEVWSWNGTAWVRIAGGSVNGSWADATYQRMLSLAVYNGQLYAGTGTTTPGNGDVWRYNGTSWTQIGGDGLNNSWAVGTIENVSVLTTYRGKLFAGLGNTQNADALMFSIGNNAYVESSTSSFDTAWRHVAATYDGTAMRIFINGTQDAIANASATGLDSSNALLIGTSYGGSAAGVSQGYLSGQIDELRISNAARGSFTTKPYSDTNQAVTLSTAVRTGGVGSWDGLASNETLNGGTISYRLSDNDGTTWKYWNGSTWVDSNGLTQANNINTINANIGSFPVTFSGIRWQAILRGDGNQRVQLNSVTLTANSDTDPPGNASNIQAYKSNGGDEITSNAWTNASTPYFTWSAGSDSGSGLLGYCLYLGTSSTADPATTKGLLGANPTENGGNCQFTITNNQFDLSTAGYLASGLTTSNSPYYLIIKAIDKAGNVSNDAEQFQFRFDNTPPSNPGFITAPSQVVSNKEVTFTWPTNGANAPYDDNSGLAGLQYRIGPNGSWYGDGAGGSGLLVNDGTYTTRQDPDFPNINEGINTVFFRTVDQAGNVTSAFVTAALRLNTTSPTSPQSVTATPTVSTTNSFEFSWDPPASFGGSPGSLVYCYTVNTLPNANTCTFTAPGVTSLPAGAYATQPGENTFYVVARDEASNINYATAASTTFTANTSAPGIPLDPEVADVSNRATSTWRLALSWIPPTNVGAGVSSYRILRSLDNTTFTQVASTAGTSYVDSGLTQQQYYYQIRACDSANNCGAVSSVISATPTGRFTSPANLTAQPRVSGISTKRAVVRWSTDRESDSKISIGTTPGQYQPFQIASPQQVTDHTIELNNLTPGTTYYAKATWTDEDGNTGSSSEFSFTTEPAPSTQEVLTTRVSLSAAQIRFTSVSAAKVVIQYGKSDNFGAVKEVATSLSKSTYDVELTGLDDGSKYFFRLNTFDAEGNEYVGSTVLTFTTPPRPRIENLRFQPVEGEPTSTQRISWQTNVPSSSLVRFSPAGSPAKEVSSSALVTNHEVTVRDLLDDTSYTFIAESRDKDGNLAVSDAQNLRTALDTRPPKISDIRVETSIRGTGAEARGQIVVSWKTDEPSTSQVAYAEGTNVSSFNNRTSEDTALATEHIVIVSDLPTSRVYSVQPIASDRSNNESVGSIESAIIGRASDSVITIVLNTLRRVFGF